ncbi:amidohydrolase family protein [Nocardioides sp. cx-173]|uniref:amidohydrolase family protein n=1 Tax=Nocardioides sp. cx-173 TaxID=2898796 RepID=UPI001E418151|nr:amidohydrolase family protein [Nocardioides sp. cx-173]MCD4524253.1 amidohydrolase [Nocardioides sp. cx-173]UGB41645.1 amidohydrolase [Nocardioides sp. cx-173]
MMVSVDDHIVEPATIWTDRLPASYGDQAPRLVREKLPSVVTPGTDVWADVWHFGQRRIHSPRAFAASTFAVGQHDFDGLANSMEPMTYEEMRPGAYDMKARLLDMDVDGIEASVCFPNAFVRFCGQTFLEHPDKELALLCVRAYNDWMIEEWQGPSDGRLFGMTVVPLWDAELAAAEVRRNAARGLTSMTFAATPPSLGLPSVYTRYWDPLFLACEETGTVINIHLGAGGAGGSSATKDSPIAMGVTIAMNFSPPAWSMCDWIISGVFERFPNLRVAYSEAQAGWMPYVLHRLDSLYDYGPELQGFDRLPERPSTYVKDHIFACVFDDPVVIDQLAAAGPEGYHGLTLDNICFESDYPHTDSSFPYTRDNARSMTAPLNEAQRTKVLRTNAAKLYNIERVLKGTEDKRLPFGRDKPLEPAPAHWVPPRMTLPNGWMVED